MRLAHQRVRLAAHSRVLLVPVVGMVFLLVGAFFPGPTDSDEAWAFSCTAIGAIAAWVVVTIDRTVPPQAEAMLTAHAGGAAARRTAQFALVAELAAVLTAVFVIVPELAGVLSPAPSVIDVAAAALGLFSSAVFGGALGLALGRPIRGGTAFAGVVAVYIGFAVIVPVAPAVAGPVGVSRALVATDTPASAALLVAVTITLLYAAACAGILRRSGRLRG